MPIKLNYQVLDFQLFHYDSCYSQSKEHIDVLVSNYLFLQQPINVIYIPLHPKYNNLNTLAQSTTDYESIP